MKNFNDPRQFRNDVEEKILFAMLQAHELKQADISILELLEKYEITEDLFLSENKRLIFSTIKQVIVLNDDLSSLEQSLDYATLMNKIMEQNPETNNQQLTETIFEISDAGNTGLGIYNIEAFCKKLMELDYKDKLQVKLMETMDTVDNSPFGLTEKKTLEIFAGIKDMVNNTIKETKATDKDIMNLIFKNINTDTKPEKIQTGISSLDNILSGGIEHGQMVVIGARPSIGKTSIALTMANAFINQKKKCTFVTLENSSKSTMEKLLSIRTNIPIEKIKKYKSISQEEVLKVSGEINNMIHDVYMTQVIDPKEKFIETILEKIDIMKTNNETDIIIFDYLQILQSIKEKKNKNISTHDKVTVIANTIQHITRRLNIPVIVLAQLSRESENHPTARLSHLRDSGSIEANADIAILMSQTGIIDQNNAVVTLNVAKNRDGKTGSVDVVFKKDISKFITMTYEYERQLVTPTAKKQTYYNRRKT